MRVASYLPARQQSKPLIPRIICPHFLAQPCLNSLRTCQAVSLGCCSISERCREGWGACSACLRCWASPAGVQHELLSGSLACMPGFLTGVWFSCLLRCRVSCVSFIFSLLIPCALQQLEVIDTAGKQYTKLCLPHTSFSCDQLKCCHCWQQLQIIALPLYFDSLLRNKKRS